MEAQKFLSKLEQRFKGKLRDVFNKQIQEQELPEIEICEQSVKTGVVPHPSGLNSAFWASPSMETVKVLKLIRNEFIHTIGKSSA